MYKDVLAKITFHKERIIREYIKQGIYPNNELIASKLAEIDTSLSFLRPDKMVSGNEFNVEVFNNMINMIYKDLELLYQLLYEIVTKEYVNLKAFIDTHLTELENTAKKYELKAEQEANSTSLGTTIFFQHSEFDLYTKDNVAIVDLGTININKGSRIACFLNASDIEANKVVFGFKKGTDSSLYTTAYNYNQDSLVIPGELEKNVYTVSVESDQIINGSVEMNLDGNKVLEENSYVILGGKNKILVKGVSGVTSQHTMDRPTRLNAAAFIEKSYIDFYVIGGTTITFRFNKKPISANFALDNYTVSNLSHIQHFFIECDAGFSFDFELDNGNVYAVKEDGYISNSKLYYSGVVDAREFLIEEYKTGSPDEYNAFIKITNDTGTPIEIESVLIKELIALGGDT